MVVELEISGHDGPPKIRIEDVLAGVTWASDPGNEVTWPRVSDWTL
jgi:hypothetical protein